MGVFVRRGFDPQCWSRDRYVRGKAWFDQKCAEKGLTFFADAPTTLDPRTVPGEEATISYVRQQGIRRWAFPNAQARDRFVSDHQGTGATAA